MRRQKKKLALSNDLSQETICLLGLLELDKKMDKHQEQMLVWTHHGCALHLHQMRRGDYLGTSVSILVSRTCHLQRFYSSCFSDLLFLTHTHTMYILTHM